MTQKTTNDDACKMIDAGAEKYGAEMAAIKFENTVTPALDKALVYRCTIKKLHKKLEALKSVLSIASTGFHKLKELLPNWSPRQLCYDNEVFDVVPVPEMKTITFESLCGAFDDPVQLEAVLEELKVYDVSLSRVTQLMETMPELFTGVDMDKAIRVYRPATIRFDHVCTLKEGEAFDPRRTYVRDSQSSENDTNTNKEDKGE